jgi:hypothetical protein
MKIENLVCGKEYSILCDNFDDSLKGFKIFINGSDLYQSVKKFKYYQEEELIQKYIEAFDRFQYEIDSAPGCLEFWSKLRKLIVVISVLFDIDIQLVENEERHDF